MAFGDVEVGTTSTQTVTFSSAGTGSLTVSQAAVSGAGFIMTGQTFPLTLSAGQSSSLSVQFAPTVTGSTTGSISLVSNASNSPSSVTLNGNGVRHQLSIVPSNVSFGNVMVGTANAQTVTLTNSGTANLNISQGSVTGAGFGMSGLNFPLSLAPGQSSTFNAQFAPTVPGSASGTLTIASNAPNSPATVALSGLGVQGTLTANPSSFNFGNVLVGSSGTQTFTLSNSSTASVTISAVGASGTGLSIAGLSVPATLNAGQNTSFTVSFAPASAASLTGSVSITSNAPGSPLTIALSGTGVQPQLAATPSSASFGNVVTGTSNSQTINLTNGGSASVTISQANLTGTGFGITGLALPVTIVPGKSATFNIVFAPTTPGGVSGSVSLVSNAPNSPLVISTTGTGVAPILQLSASPASLSFGNVTVGSSATQAVTLTSTGNSSVSVSQINVTVTAFSVSGMALPVTLSAGQSASFNVMFAPLTSGGLTDSVSVLSTASNSPATIAISGTGVLAASHSVVLTWNPSTSVVVGYYIYRGTQTGGPYTKLNSTPVLTTYTDSAVLSGQTYFYVATAVDSNSIESLFSTEVSATIP